MPVDPPLKGVRVLDIATFIAAPFCGTVLGDFGAEVIKIEQPGEGDSLRRFGTPSDCGDTFVWLSEARNKKSVTLDLRTPEGAGLFRSLVAQSDVVLENFRPGTLEKWGLGYEQLSAINDKLILLRISAYGQTGPYRHKPGFARIAHAFSGLAYLAGEAGRTPVMPGSTSLADYMSGLWGAVGVLIALRTVERGGKGQVIDLALYESVFRVLDEIAPVFAKRQFVRERMGPDTVNAVPHSHYQTLDGEWIALACSNDRMFERLTEIMGQPELAASPAYRTMPARVACREEINRIVSDWVGSLTTNDILDRCEQGEVPCALLYSIEDMFGDPQYRARQNFFEAPSRAGPVVLPSALPKMSATPPVFKSAGPALGADTDEILSRLCGLSSDEIAMMRARKIV